MTKLIVIVRLFIALVFFALVGLAALQLFMHWREGQSRPFEMLERGEMRASVRQILGEPKESFQNSPKLIKAAEDWNLLCCEMGRQIPSGVGLWDRRLRYYDEITGVLRALPEVEASVDFYWASTFLGYFIYYDSNGRLYRVLRCAP